MEAWLVTALLEAGVPVIAIGVMAYFAREQGRLQRQVERNGAFIRSAEIKLAMLIARMNALDGQRIPRDEPTNGDPLHG